VHQFEKSEVAGTISLRQLSLVAAAIGGRVSYRVDADDGLREVSVAPMKEAESRDVSVPDRSVSDTPTSAATERSNRLGAGSVGPAAPLVHDYFENRPD
jgi:hypothetical protein